MRRIGSIWLGLALAVGLAGCTGYGTPELDKHWGSAVRDNRTQMVANPAAGELNRDPVEGLDPASAENTMTKMRRQEAQAQAAPQEPSVINISTGGR
jgi:hypothetical protein